MWAAALNPSRFKVVYNSLSTLTVMDFRPRGRAKLPQNTLFNDIQGEINRYALEKRIRSVIIIDEANMLSHKILSDLQIMFNFEMDSRDRAVLLLVCQPA